MLGGKKSAKTIFRNASLTAVITVSVLYIAVSTAFVST